MRFQPGAELVKAPGLLGGAIIESALSHPFQAESRPNRDQKLSIGGGILPLPLSSAVEM